MKKITGILGVAAIAAIMFFSANTVTGSAKDVSLASLLTMNTANAECTYNEFEPELNTGGCSQLTGNCYAQDTWRQPCDPWAMGW